MFHGNIGKTNNCIHRSSNVVGHIVEECTFRRIGRLCHHAQLIQFLIRFLLHLHQLGTALYSNKTDERQQHQQRHS